MSSSQFILAISIILVLLIIPAIVALAVRRFIRDEEPDEDEISQIEPPMQFDSLRDFWESNVPHLIELRDRLIKAVAGVLLGTMVGSYVVFAQPFGFSLVDFLAAHFLQTDKVEGSLQAVEVAEFFVSSMGVAIGIGIAIAMPVIIYQIVAFFAPGLYAREKRIVFTALPFVLELFLAGLVFGWFFTVPTAINFLVTFGSWSKAVEIKPTVSDFLGIITRLMLWNGVIFEMPAVIFLLARIGVVSLETLRSTRRYAFVIIVIIAAFITPTGDPYNLMLMALPMYALYEMGILLARLVPRPSADAAAQPSSGG